MWYFFPNEEHLLIRETERVRRLCETKRQAIAGAASWLTVVSCTLGKVAGTEGANAVFRVLQNPTSQGTPGVCPVSPSQRDETSGVRLPQAGLLPFLWSCSPGTATFSLQEPSQPRPRHTQTPGRAWPRPAEHLRGAGHRAGGQRASVRIQPPVKPARPGVPFPAARFGTSLLRL